MKKQYKGVIFDLDGTLLNTLGTYSSIMNGLLKKNDFPTHEERVYSEFIGNGARNFVTQSLPKENRKDPFIDVLLHEFHLKYENTYRENSVVYTGIIKLLLDLQKEGVKLALLSNKKHHLTEKCVKYFLPDISFVHVLGQSEKYKKPDPSGVKEITRLLEVTPKDLVFVGDTEVDINTAKNAEMDSVAVTWGFRKKESLLTLNPNYIAENVEELWQVLSSQSKINA